MARNPNTDVYGRSFSQSTVDYVWSKGLAVSGYDPNTYRKDACGAWMQRTAYGDRNSNLGWEIDHIKPVAKGGTDDWSNLQPMYWLNNAHKSDDWPNWSCGVSAAA